MIIYQNQNITYNNKISSPTPYRADEEWSIQKGDNTLVLNLNLLCAGLPPSNLGREGDESVFFVNTRRCVAGSQTGLKQMKLIVK